jgi:hypothetical protein
MKTDIEQAIRSFDKLIEKHHARYISLNNKLDSHRGKELADTNLDEVNNLLKEIQEEFAILYPALYFIAHRYAFACEVTNQYNELIQVLEKVGSCERKAN